MAARELIERIDGLGFTALETTAYRHVSPGRNPRSGQGARIQGGRWNPPESFGTLYLGLSVETVRAEFHRLAQKQGLRPEDFIPRELHRFEVRLEQVLDLRRSAARQLVGLSDQELRSDDPRKCQLIGEAAHYLGLEAILAPSASDVGDVLAVFLDLLGPNSFVESAHMEIWRETPAR